MRSGRRPSQQSRLIRSALGVFVRAVDAWCTLYAGLLLTAPHSTNTKKYRSVLTHNERKGQQQKRHTDATNQKPLRYANKIAAIFLRFFLRFFLVVFSRQKIDRIIKYEKMTIDRRTYNSWGEMHLQNDHTRSKTKQKHGLPSLFYFVSAPFDLLVAGPFHSPLRLVLQITSVSQVRKHRGVWGYVRVQRWRAVSARCADAQTRPLHRNPPAHQPTLSISRRKAFDQTKNEDETSCRASCDVFSLFLFLLVFSFLLDWTESRSKMSEKVFPTNDTCWYWHDIRSTNQQLYWWYQ